VLKKAVFINGGPRKKGNTRQLLEAAADGASELGVEVDFFDLYDLSFKGCSSCYACKLRDNAVTMCAMDDDLRPVLESIHTCDIVVIGSPIYWFEVTGEARSFFERLLYPCITYDHEPGSSTVSRFGRRIKVVLFFTMGVDEDMAHSMGLFDLFERYKGLLDNLLGDTEFRTSCNTLQFGDYSRYAARRFDETAARERHNTVFQAECQAAKKLLIDLIP
jgi:multimeric flavodoxin WrbA